MVLNGLRLVKVTSSAFPRTLVADSNASDDTNSIKSLSEFRRLIFQCGIQSLMHADQ